MARAAGALLRMGRGRGWGGEVGGREMGAVIQQGTGVLWGGLGGMGAAD